VKQDFLQQGTFFQTVGLRNFEGHILAEWTTFIVLLSMVTPCCTLTPEDGTSLRGRVRKGLPAEMWAKGAAVTIVS
jgi:hypothetical protein